MMLKHLLVGGTIRLYSDGHGNPTDNPAYCLVGGTFSKNLHEALSLNKDDITWFDRMVVKLWWNDYGFKQVKHAFRTVRGKLARRVA